MLFGATSVRAVASLTLRASGTADPDEVWERYADTRRWSQWSPQIRSVQTDDRPRISIGMRGVVRPLVGPGVRFLVTDVDEQSKTWSWQVEVGPIRLALEHAVIAQQNGCATSLRLRGPAPIIVGYSPVASIALHRLVRR